MAVEPLGRSGGAGMASAPEIVAVTFRGDVGADLVVLEAERRGVPLFRFNGEDYPASVGLVLDPAHPERTSFSTSSGHVAVGSARGIWMRRPRIPVISDDVLDQVDRAFATAEATAAIASAWRLLSDRCVSPPDAMAAAGWKPAQLAVARSAGMQVPETLVTSDPAAARDFAARGRTVIKAVGRGRVVAAEGERAGGTVELDSHAELEAVRPAPVLLQRRVDKAADLRVTIVGRRVFAVRITTPADAPLDFRLTSPSECGFEAVNADLLSSPLHAFMDFYGLRFGAFDLAEDRDGTLWFLECNTAGQWGWLERPAGIDITGALVDLLLRPGRDTR